MGPGPVRSVLLACLLAALAALVSWAPAEAGTTPPGPARHVVIVGISGLRWSEV